jgi:mannosyltransferase
VKVKDAALEHRVTFAGFISNREQLRRLYQHCGAFVSCSVREAVQLVMLEAMSCGAAVVATRIPTFLELIDDGINGRLVSVGRPDEIAKAVLDVYDKRKIFGANARKTVTEKYSSGNVYLRLSQVIEEAQPKKDASDSALFDLTR